MPDGSRHNRLDSEEPVQLSYIQATSKHDQATNSNSDITLEKGHGARPYDHE